MADLRAALDFGSRWVKEIGGATLVVLPPCGPMGVRFLQGACLTLEVVGRLASFGPMSMVAAHGGPSFRGRGGRGGRGGGVGALGGAGSPISW